MDFQHLYTNQVDPETIPSFRDRMTGISTSVFHLINKSTLLR